MHFRVSSRGKQTTLARGRMGWMRHQRRGERAGLLVHCPGKPLSLLGMLIIAVVQMGVRVATSKSVPVLPRLPASFSAEGQWFGEGHLSASARLTAPQAV